MNDIKDAEAFCHRRPRAKAIRMTKASDNAGKSATTKNNNIIIITQKEGKAEDCNYSIRQMGDLSQTVQGDLSTLYKSRPRMPSKSLQSPPPLDLLALTAIHPRLLTISLPNLPLPSCRTIWPKQQPLPPVLTAPSAVAMQKPKPGIARSERPTSSRYYLDAPDMALIH